MKEVGSAYKTVQIAHSNLAVKLLGRTDVSARCLFTNAFPELGDLTQNLHQVCDVMSSLNSVFEACCSRLVDQVDLLLKTLSPEDTSATERMTKNVDRLGAEYESKLLDILESRKKLRTGSEHEIMTCRKEYELARYDLVSKVNENDRNKKLMLTQATCDIFYMFHTVFADGFNIVDAQLPYFGKIQNRAVEVEKQMPVIKSVWMQLWAKLEGELMGALPAPGSPVGALSPINPRQHQVCDIVLMFYSDF